MPAPNIAVTIPAFEEEQYLEVSTESVAVQAQKLGEQVAIVIVDNGSTDATLEVAEKLQTRYSGLVHILGEDEKGIGTACDTGFRFGIEELGATILARVDADTITTNTWLESVLRKHKANSRLRLLTGPVIPGTPDYVSPVDQLLIPAAKTVGKAIKAARYHEPSMLRFVPGHNMSTTANAYTEVGGFSRHGPLTEDVDYNLKIAGAFGLRAFGFEKNMAVYTSQRRIRELGYFGAVRYYMQDAEHN